MMRRCLSDKREELKSREFLREGTAAEKPRGRKAIDEFRRLKGR